MRGGALVTLFVLFALSACGQGAPPSPFDDGAAGADAGGAGGEAGAGEEPVLGGDCLDDDQCDDGIDCTDDTCDLTRGRCLITPVSSRCVDDIYCNGLEVCAPGIGCREGEVVACSDDTPCTIDVCVEATQSCAHQRRDADGDGDPVWNCGGTDCDDTNPRINAAVPEVCGNDLDDNCEAGVDEPDCTTPQYDTCTDPLVVEASGSYPLSLAAAAEDVALSCVEGGGTRRDVVVALVVPEGEATDVDVAVTSLSSSIALAAAANCSDASSELACMSAESREGSGSVARLVLRQLAPGTYPLFISGSSDDEVTLRVSYGPALPQPDNETCGTAARLEPATNVQVSLAGTARDLSSACGSDGGDVVYRFELVAPSDVSLRALSLDGHGLPRLALRSAACAQANSELTCRSSSPAVLFARALPAGTYYAVVSSSGPTDIDVRLDLEPASEPPTGEGCAAVPELVSGLNAEQNLGHRSDAVQTRCMPGGVDATFALTLEQSSDVLLVQRLSAGDTGALSLLGASCRPASELACSSADVSPLRARLDSVAAGEYRVVAESALGAPTVIAAFTRPASVPTLVPFADNCDDALVIPASGGRFIGNTANVNADYEASCDFGSGFPGGAPEQMLRLELEAPRRVILDAQASGYDTLLVVRRASECPGREVEAACAPAQGAARSYLDMTLPAGDYFVQVDGYNRAAGRWVLDVFTEPR